MVSPLSGMALQGQPVDLAGSLLAGRDAYQGSQLNQQAIQQNQQQIARADYEQGVERLKLINRLAVKVKQLPPDRRQGFVGSLNQQMLQSVGIDPAQISGVQLDDQSLDALIAQTGAAIPEAEASVGQKEFESLTSGLSEQDKERARRIKLRLDPGAVGSAAITTATTGLTEDVAGSQATIEGAKAGSREAAKLDEQLNKLPQVKAAVASAEQQVKELGDRRSTSAQNQISMNMYQAAMKGLILGLEGTDTGAIAGRLPAITANQQIADGAVAAMAPILKATFRTAGEGTFTNQDQELLLAMVPTRKDEPEARAAKINNINAIIAAKLATQGSQSAQGATPGIAPAAVTSKYKVEVMD